MNTIKFNKKNTLVVAHRGLSGIEKENTNSAFVAAGNRSYFGIETDVHRTIDGKYVIIHDFATDRVAVDDLDVEHSTLESLRSLLLTDTDGKKGRYDIRIPTLSEYISICKKYEKTAVLELKSDFTASEIAEIADIISSFGYLDNVIFISFILENLLILRKQLPDSTLQYLVGEFNDKIFNTLVENKLDLDIYYPSLTEEDVNKLHSAGIKVNCWTCDDAQYAEKLCAWGVDFITSDILE